VKIGYSFWGFLGAGVVDTPDGGRSHRRIWVDALRADGHRLIFLQANRDLAEAREDFRHEYQWDAGLPDIDLLFLEWRWPIEGRNVGTPCGHPAHTCDLHRQHELVTGYTRRRRVPTVVWDKDQRLPTDDPIRRLPNVVVADPALSPRAGGHSLLFPVNRASVVHAQRMLPALVSQPRALDLVYIGNQYDRDERFDQYVGQPARVLNHAVYGKWTRTDRWPHVNFRGRIAFPDVALTYREALASPVLLPPRYETTGQVTQRLVESVLNGCLPIMPGSVRHAHRVVPETLVLGAGEDVVALVRRLRRERGSADHERLLGECLARLEPFHVDRQRSAFRAMVTEVLERAG
jgi:hypothetical protein